MFERFTDRARRVVVLAQEAARMLHHDYIGTEHFLLGLISEAECVGARAPDNPRDQPSHSMNRRRSFRVRQVTAAVQCGS
jgi:ATP-dependent Clp protease ATP-binding subunit ClpA